MPAGAVEVAAADRAQRAPARWQAAHGPFEFGEGPVDEVDEGIGVGEGAAGAVRAQQGLPAVPDFRVAGGEGGDQVGLHAPIVPRLSGVGSAPLGLPCAPVGGV